LTKLSKEQKRILNIGCGKTRIPGSIGLDCVKIDDYVDVVHDLDLVPYPFANNYFDEVHMYHVLEHLHNPVEKIGEVHRILKPEGILYLRVPHFSSMGAFTDITHVRPFGYFSFEIFTKSSCHCYYSKVHFEILSNKIKYLGLYPNDGVYEKYIHRNQCPYLARPFVRLLNFLINLSPMFFERFWCYLVGGATEVLVILRKK